MMLPRRECLRSGRAVFPNRSCYDGAEPGQGPVCGDWRMIGRERGAEPCCRVVVELGTLAHVRELLKRNGTIPHADECTLCDLCIKAAPEGTVQVVKLYE